MSDDTISRSVNKYKILHSTQKTKPEEQNLGVTH